jgi:6-pyruvoyl-tetrahydropterin synthase
VEPVVHAVRDKLDHKYLNDLPGLAMPTLENVAAWIWRELEGKLMGLDRVELRRGADGHGEGCVFSRQRDALTRWTTCGTSQGGARAASSVARCPRRPRARRSRHDR